MSIITTLTRSWLTRSFQPFVFKDEYDNILDYQDCDHLGLYVHIPFCKSLCHFCPYCKQLYSKELCDEYIDHLLLEIEKVGSQYHQKKDITSLYFGGGTPALASHRIKEIINKINDYFIIHEGIGLELHPDNIDIQTLMQLKEAGVTKISIGIQSFQSQYQHILQRKKINIENIKNALKEVHFETVSMDFIFALPNQTFIDLKNDIDTAFDIGANHIAIYPFIDFSFTNSQVSTLNKKDKQQLLDQITHYCLDKGYIRNSIWTFSKQQASYSSMTRDNFLGFGCSATTLLKDSFKINTFYVKEYCKRIKTNQLPTSLTIRFTLRQRMIYYLFWSAYSTQVNAKDFKYFFNVPLNKMYGLEFKLAELLGFIKKDNHIYTMTLKGAFYYHYYENFYTLAYIDKMWSILRKQAFPKNIKL